MRLRVEQLNYSRRNEKVYLARSMSYGPPRGASAALLINRVGPDRESAPTTEAFILFSISYLICQSTSIVVRGHHGHFQLLPIRHHQRGDQTAL